MTSWRTRTRGSRSQIGKKFPIYQEKKKLPKLVIPGVLKNVREIPVRNLVPREAEPVDAESRAKYFIDRYGAGIPLPPIWVEPLGQGKFRILDGHIRWYAAKALGIKTLQANVMSQAQLDRMKLHKIPKVLHA